MTSYVSRVFTGWSIFRWLRLVIGVYVSLDTAFRGEWMFFPIGLMLTAQAVFNAGCVNGNCGVPASSGEPANVESDALDMELKEPVFVESGEKISERA